MRLRTHGEKYPAIVRSWTNAWAEFVPFLAVDAESRKVVCSTNAIESVNARIRRMVLSASSGPDWPGVWVRHHPAGSIGRELVTRPVVGVGLATPASERRFVQTDDFNEIGRVYLELADATSA